MKTLKDILIFKNLQVKRFLTDKQKQLIIKLCNDKNINFNENDIENFSLNKACFLIENLLSFNNQPQQQIYKEYQQHQQQPNNQNFTLKNEILELEKELNDDYLNYEFNKTNKNIGMYRFGMLNFNIVADIDELIDYFLNELEQEKKQDYQNLNLNFNMLSKLKTRYESWFKTRLINFIWNREYELFGFDGKKIIADIESKVFRLRKNYFKNENMFNHIKRGLEIYSFKELKTYKNYLIRLIKFSPKFETEQNNQDLDTLELIDNLQKQQDNQKIKTTQQEKEHFIKRFDNPKIKKMVDKYLFNTKSTKTKSLNSFYAEPAVESSIIYTKTNNNLILFQTEYQKEPEYLLEKKNDIFSLFLINIHLLASESKDKKMFIKSFESKEKAFSYLERKYKKSLVGKPYFKENEKIYWY